MEFILLLNEYEPERPTTTGPVILKTLPQSRAVIWHRGIKPETLIAEINAPDTQAWLLFPADREELSCRQQAFLPAPNKRNLIIVPDGTWKEVRKIVRKSPWLDHLPLITFTPAHPSRYTLRRNAHNQQLCTAEAVTELLRQGNEIAAAENLNHAFEYFMHRYREQQHHRSPTPLSLTDGTEQP